MMILGGGKEAQVRDGEGSSGGGSDGGGGVGLQVTLGA